MQQDQDQQDGCHRGAQDGVTTRAFGRRRPPFVRITCTSFPPSNWPLLAPFPLNIWGADRASISRTSHHSRRGRALDHSDHPQPLQLTKLKDTSPQEAVLPLYLFILSLQGNPPHHTGVGCYTTSVARTSINHVSFVLRVRRAEL